MIYIVLKIDETQQNGEPITCSVIDIAQTHIEAYKIMIQKLNSEKDKNDIVIVAGNNRVVVYKNNTGWIKNSKTRRFIYSIQEFADQKKPQGKKMIVS